MFAIGGSEQCTYATGVRCRGPMRSLLSLVSFVALGSLAACTTASDAGDAPGEYEDGFAVLDVSAESSVLTSIARKNGNVAVCVGLIGFSDANAAAREMKTEIDHVTNAWNALLQGNGDWQVARVTPTYTMQASECSATQGDLRINVWAERSRFENEFCARRPSWICSANTDYTLRTIAIGPVNRGVDVDVFDEGRLLHEYGHAQGLADTYKVPGAHDWTGSVQPASVMNGKSETLTEDDKLGLWLTWRSLRTGDRSCDGLGTKVQFTSNVWNSVMCDALAQPVLSHGTRMDRDDVFFRERSKTTIVRR